RAGLSGVFSPAPPTAAAVEHARARGLLLARAGETPKRRPVALYSGALSGGGVEKGAAPITPGPPCARAFPPAVGS
ncbi:hypothetical protein, partial [Corynebacterium mastitidis]